MFGVLRNRMLVSQGTAFRKAFKDANRQGLHKVHGASGTALRLPASRIPLLPTTNGRGRNDDCHPLFTDVETEARRGWAIVRGHPGSTWQSPNSHPAQLWSPRSRLEDSAACSKRASFHASHHLFASRDSTEAEVAVGGGGQGAHRNQSSRTRMGTFDP